MWVILNNSFLSIVKPTGTHHSPDTLLVRARRAGDIERVFSAAFVMKTPDRDYMFRALIDKEQVAEAMVQAVNSIDYVNFKNSIKNNRFHDACSRIWHIMHALQPMKRMSDGDSL